jgi:hypothetical protein
MASTKIVVGAFHASENFLSADVMAGVLIGTALVSFQVVRLGCRGGSSREEENGQEQTLSERESS